MILPIEISAQITIDSLKSDLRTAEASNQYYDIGNSLTKLGEFYLTRNYDSSHYYYHLALTYNSFYQHKDLIARNLNDLGYISDKLGRPDSAVLYYNRAITAYHATRDSSKVVETRSNLALVYKNLDLYDAALKESFTILPRLEAAPRFRVLGSAYNTIATVYARMGNFNESLLYHYKALKIRTDSAYTKGMGQSYNNMGSLFLEFNLYDSALLYFKKAFALKKTINESTGSTLHNIGSVYLEQQQPDSAEVYFVKSLADKRQAKDLSGLPSTLNSLAKLEISRKNYPRAKNLLDESEQVGIPLKQSSDLCDTYQLQGDLFEKMGDFKMAFNSLQKMTSIQEAIRNEEVFKDALRVRVSYENERAQRRLDLKESEIENKRLLIIFLVVGIVLVAIIGSLIYSQLSLTRKSKEKVETLLKELNHRVKNNLQLLSSLFTLQSSNLTDTDAILALKTSEGRVNTMALIHKKLYANDQAREINLRSYFTELIEYLVHTYGYNSTGQMLALKIDDINLDIDKTIPLGLIVNEAVSNALKYAYSKQTNPTLHVTIHKLGNALVITIQDNGTGGVNPETNTGFGLKIIHTLVQELKGSITIKDQNGTIVTFIIPIP